MGLAAKAVSGVLTFTETRSGPINGLGAIDRRPTGLRSGRGNI